MSNQPYPRYYTGKCRTGYGTTNKELMVILRLNRRRMLLSAADLVFEAVTLAAVNADRSVKQGTEEASVSTPDEIESFHMSYSIPFLKDGQVVGEYVAIEPA